MKRILMLGLVLVILLIFSGFGMGMGWGGHFRHTLNVGVGQEYATITEALADASNGDTIMIYQGVYNESISIENFNGLTIKSAFWNNVTIQPAETLAWNIGDPNYDARLAAIRVVNSTNIKFESLTFDFDLVKTAGRMHGVLYWNSTGSLKMNTFKNLSFPDAQNGYSEVCLYARAPGYTDFRRASLDVSWNTFIDVGRLAVCTHDYVNAMITGNVFYKTNADFGYAIEMGSTSSGFISYNTIYGYNTPALSDGSNSAGIYVENCFTSGSSAVTKRVNVTGNNVYDCQWALYVGNEWDGYAGDVDISLTMMNNRFHDNTDGAVCFADEDKEYGSSLKVWGSGNSLTNNGDYGYYIYTSGDGDISVTLSGEKISGHDVGIQVEDFGSPSSSSYAVMITRSDINDNASYGINNLVAGLTVNATWDWWGDASGPFHLDTNPEGKGDTVSDNVNFAWWLKWATRPWFW